MKMPGFTATTSLYPSGIRQGPYVRDLEAVKCTGVMPARLPGDRPTGNRGSQGENSSCVADCTGDCVGVQNRGNCIANCVHGCDNPPEQTLPAGPGQSPSISIDSNTIDTIIAVGAVATGLVLLGGLGACAQKNGAQMSFTTDGLMVQCEW